METSFLHGNNMNSNCEVKRTLNPDYQKIFEILKCYKINFWGLNYSSLIIAYTFLCSVHSGTFNLNSFQMTHSWSRKQRVGIVCKMSKIVHSRGYLGGQNLVKIWSK